MCCVLPEVVLGKNSGVGDWPLIIWEATMSKRNYYRTYTSNMWKS